MTIAYGDTRLPLRARQQVAYTDVALERPTVVDAAEVTAWTAGQLIFRRTPLEEVIRQVNRYRPGRIVVVGEHLRNRPVSGVFFTGNMQGAIIQLQQITGARATQLPGGLVLFS